MKTTIPASRDKIVPTTRRRGVVDIRVASLNKKQRINVGLTRNSKLATKSKILSGNTLPVITLQ